MECLGNGVSLEGIVSMVNRYFVKLPVVKAYVDSDEIWSDLLSFYKCISSPCKKRVRVCLSGVPSIEICSMVNLLVNNDTNVSSVGLVEAEADELPPSDTSERSRVLKKRG